MTQENLDLLQLPASRATQLRARAAEIVRCDARHTDFEPRIARSICQTTFSPRRSPLTAPHGYGRNTWPAAPPDGVVHSSIATIEQNYDKLQTMLTLLNGDQK